MKVISHSDMAPSHEGINSIKMKRKCFGVKPVIALDIVTLVSLRKLGASVSLSRTWK